MAPMESVCDNCINAECVWRAPTGGIDPPVMFCPQKKEKPMTNYDRLISKTPEELAKWMVWYGNNGITCKFEDFDIVECGYGPEYDSAINWLKSPAEEEQT